jgi:hypothetical protein
MQNTQYQGSMRKFAVFACLFLATRLAVSEGDAVAVVHAQGPVYVNGQQLTVPSLPVWSGDILQTREAGIANLSGTRSTALIRSNTTIRVQPTGFSLDRGGISIGTGKQSAVFTRDFKITPVSSTWTRFEVLRIGGIIQVAAREKDVLVSCGTSRPILVKEGKELSREDVANCGVAGKDEGAPVASTGPILDSPIAQKAGIALGAGLGAWIFFQPEDPISPSAP